MFCGGLTENTQKEALEAEASCWPRCLRILRAPGGEEGFITR